MMRMDFSEMYPIVGAFQFVMGVPCWMWFLLRENPIEMDDDWR